MKIQRKWLAIGGLAVVLATSGAFTASVDITPANTYVGYGQQSVSNVTVTSMTYTYNNNNPRQITAVDLVITENLEAAGSTVELTFNASGPVTTCSVGTFAGTQPVTCTLASPVTVTGVTSTDITVH